MHSNPIQKLWLSLILLPLFSISANAQLMVAGKVTDAKNSNVIEYAVVKTYRASDTVLVGGAITDENGFFKVEALKEGTYYLEVTSIGYQRNLTGNFVLNSSTPNKFFRQLSLSPSSTQLKEATVSGQKSFVANSIDRKTYNVEDMAINRGSNVSEVLEIIPSVDVDIDGNISLRGSQNLTVLIDGKPTLISNSDLQSLFETLPANSIKKIEVITNPSAKYDPDGMAGIINIVTKKNKLEGFFGNVNVGAAYNGRYNAGGMLNIKQGKWSTMLNAGVNYGDRFRNGSSFRRTYGDTNNILNQTSDGANIGLGGRAMLSIAYAIDKSSNVTLSATSSIHDMTMDEEILYENSLENFDPYSRFSRNSETEFNMNFSNVKLDYTKDYKGQDHNLSASLMLNSFTMNTTSEFLQSLNEVNPSEWSIINQRNRTEANIPSFLAQVDYVKPLKKNSFLEMGAKTINKFGQAFLLAEVKEGSEWVKEALWSNDYQVDEGIHSVYGVFKQQRKKLGYQIGLRLEQAFTDAFLLESNDTFHNEYFSPFPTLHLSYKLKPKSTLKASYSRRVNRPRERAMRPFADYSDPLNVRQGNPFLLPEFIDSYELEHALQKGKHSFTSALYLKDVNNLITRVKTIDGEVATTTWKNLGSARNYGLEFVWNARFNRNWRMTFSSNAYRTEIDGGADSELNADGYQVSSKIFTTYKLPYDLTLQLSARHRSPRILPQGQISSVFWSDIAIQKRLMKNKATLNFKVSDMFNTRQFAFVTENSLFYQESDRKRESQFFQLSFQYNFGEFKPIGRSRSRRGSGSQSGGDSGDDGIEID